MTRQTGTAASHQEPPRSHRYPSSASSHFRPVQVNWGDEQVEAQVIRLEGTGRHVQLHLALPADPTFPDDAGQVEIDLHVSELSPAVAQYWVACAEREHCGRSPAGERGRRAAGRRAGA